MTKLIINHVMSNDVNSGIFNSILNYFTEFGSDQFQHVVSSKPQEGAAVYHYHRPHLENKLHANSVCTVHHDLNDPDPWHAKHRFIPRYQESAFVVCLNHSQKEILVEQGLDANKCVVIPHGYNEQLLHLKKEKEQSSSKDKIVLGLASRRYARRVKGDAYLLELAKRLDPERFRFIFVGKDRALSALELTTLGFEAKAYERLPYRLFQSFYEEIDALLMCSSHEGGPANIPEALITGTPVFSSFIGIPKDVIEHNVNGLFLTLDADVDAAYIQQVCVTEPEKFEQIKHNARSSTHLAITWAETVKQNLAVYQKIIGGKQK
ncbi:glycosyltransferase family 4 protein [Kingella kingae]|uniref:glycosyltransferase family 4 protein n=1 Tax=Kingella kingae TaxID=504 RepID=UPI002551647A|nr:glycosyltransferase family 4 protein [Kingella kingae]MDK4574072.1 glycosyltransferase family 4 protein [Kingella kingae]MDK4577182.1 glycosyltransferase family 4 protein [Kingella kingae]MDK4581999.1 glycosyltransferase family 4 protein [Kingella kingae]MDK4592325.1 glycosyltransferase family 4 protein [Kingella kingae]MDK4594318.1 glycosyltransferase family 4 protein [Kingella kingae]